MASLVWSSRGRPRNARSRIGLALGLRSSIALLFSVPNAWFAPPDHYQIKADSMTLKYNIDDGPPFAGLDVGQLLALVYGPFLVSFS